MRIVLAPLDFSDATPRVVEEAAKLAQEVNGHVILLHVSRMPERPPHFATEMAHLAEAIRETEEAADRKLLAIKEDLRARGVATQSLRLTGDPKTDIVDQAEKARADYIVMGSHGHSSFRELVMGSVTSAVIKRSNRVVVVVPAPKTLADRTADPVTKS
jgi:nucleotide-binding universal stress UspA family protein